MAENDKTMAPIKEQEIQTIDEDQIIVPAKNEHEKNVKNDQNLPEDIKLDDQDLDKVSGGDLAGSVNTYFLMQNLTTQILDNFKTPINDLEKKLKYKEVDESISSWKNSNDPNKYGEFADIYNKNHKTNWMTEEYAEALLSIKEHDTLRLAFTAQDEELRKLFINS